MSFIHQGFGRGKRLPVLEQYTAPDGTRFYNTPTGEKYPSVTTILSQKSKEAIDAWRQRVGQEQANTIARVAAGRGTGLHLAAENYLNNQAAFDESKFVNPLVREMFGTMRPELDRINNIHCQEVRMFSHHLRLAGTVDCVAEWNGKLSIIDFKSSTKPKKREWIPSYFMQCAAYAIMYEELTFIPIKQLVVVVAVEEDCTTQVFIEDRDTWAPELIKLRDQYETANSLLTNPST